MKKHLITSSCMLMSVVFLQAQTTNTTNNKTGTTQTTTGNNTSTSPSTNTSSNGHNDHSANQPSGQNITTAGPNQQGGQMTSEGRYAAMGVRAGSIPRKDMKFVVMANSSNTMELQLSQLALQKATHPAVKDFANMMVQHHTMAAKEMKQLLSSKGAMIPDSVFLSRHRSDMEMLQNLQGTAFDKAYMRIMVDAHEEDVDEFEDETTDARDADIRAFASRMMPVLTQHYSRSKEVRKQL